jgi:hypothetical protein
VKFLKAFAKFHTKKYNEKQYYSSVLFLEIPYLRVYKPHFFDKNLPSKIGVRLMHGILFLLTTEPATPVLYVVKLPADQQRPLVSETVTLQAIAHARMRQRISGVSAYFDYMRVADTIDSQKSEDRDITDKLPYMLLATTKVPRMQSQIFYFHTGKI